jgi:hypothetical protein
MTLDRRGLLAAGGAWIAACTSARRAQPELHTTAFDELLAAHAEVLPERAGAGANHYPMAAEALASLGHAGSIAWAWRAGAAGYAGELPRLAPIEDAASALGEWDRYGDWLDTFRSELARGPWRDVLARWVPTLTPGVSAALFHGLIRSAHAVRALRERETPERRAELAVGLAYWAARFAPLAVAPDARALSTPLAALAPRWVDERDDVPFEGVHARLEREPLAPRVSVQDVERPALAVLECTAREAAELLLEMLVAERHRIWLLHGVTGPAAAALIVPELPARDADVLAAFTRQAVAALWIAFGAPCTPRAHLRDAPAPWSEFVERAAASGSVHTIKLVEALARLRADDDRLCRSVAAQWFEWV